MYGICIYIYTYSLHQLGAEAGTQLQFGIPLASLLHLEAVDTSTIEHKSKPSSIYTHVYIYIYIYQ